MVRNKHLISVSSAGRTAKLHQGHSDSNDLLFTIRMNRIHSRTLKQKKNISGVSRNRNVMLQWAETHRRTTVLISIKHITFFFLIPEHSTADLLFLMDLIPIDPSKYFIYCNHIYNNLLNEPFCSVLHHDTDLNRIHERDTACYAPFLC